MSDTVTLLFAALILCPSFASAQVDAIARERIDSLKHSMDDRAASQEKAINAALASQQRENLASAAFAKEAVNKAETAVNERLSMHNQYRQQLDSQVATFPTRKEVEQQHQSLTERVNRLQERLDKGEGRDTGAASLWSLIAGALGLLIGIVGIYLAVSRANKGTT